MESLGAFLVLILMLSPAIGLFVLAALPSSKVKIIWPKRKPRAEVDPWASWKEIKANLDASREKEHEDWQTDFNRLVQATCAHSYPATHSEPTYYTCLKCKYEEPWDGPHDGCTCVYQTVTTFASPFPEYAVTHRTLNCGWHGIDWPINQRTDRSNKPFKHVTDTKTAPRWEDVWSGGGVS